jgi:DNA adenine methylase
MKPLLKWPGGKRQELPIIQQALPPAVERIFEPFVGGGAFFLHQEAKEAHINDLSEDLISFYRSIQAGSPLFIELLAKFNNLWQTIPNWDISSLCKGYLSFREKETLPTHQELERLIAPFLAELSPEMKKAPAFCSSWQAELNKRIADKIRRCRRKEQKEGLLSAEDVALNIQGACAGSLYYLARSRYNQLLSQPASSERAALFYLMRELCYGSMFRFNQQGLFNVPYGGISYLCKDLKLTTLFSQEVQERFSRVTISNMDFRLFIQNIKPEPNDFLFLDPPYDSIFSSYDKSPFGAEHQRDLCELLKSYTGHFMLVINRSELIENLYHHPSFFLQPFDKKYGFGIKNRGDRAAVHLLITNYPITLSQELLREQY